MLRLRHQTVIVKAQLRYRYLNWRYSNTEDLVWVKDVGVLGQASRLTSQRITQQL